ncbi:MAG: hypothetical protein ABIE94_05715 [archaeon]
MYELEDIEFVKGDENKKVFRFSASGDKWIMLEIKKGQSAGNHYHKGLVKVKTPEVGIVIKGKLEYELTDVKTGKKETVVVEAPKIIKIPPFVQHKLTALEDSMFIEPTSDDVMKDRFEM